MDVLQDHLDAIEGRFDSAVSMYGSTWKGPGYHSRVPPGSHVHGTRDNLDCAVLLLRSPRRDHWLRAAAVLRAVLRLQDRDPDRKTYGIWPWLLEESLDQMAPPDWNWADFCGADIATVLVETPERVDAPLRDALREALRCAAEAIIRRNVGPGYTNIAIMGAGVTAAAGEILQTPAFLDYGRARLERFAAHTAWHGGLNEYNSPTYTFVALHELERILQLVRDPRTVSLAEDLRRQVWAWLAERFHPATGQLAGPHSRAYADLLSPAAAAELAAGTGLPIVGAAPDATPAIVRHLPCPEANRSRFASLPAPETTVVSRFIREDDDARSTWGSTWLSATACLGSITYDCTWTQRRPVLAYFQTAKGTAVLRLRLLRDGHDCASGGLRTAQDGRRLLVAAQLLTDRGDHHIHLDRPADGRFTFADLRLRWELSGGEARVVDAQPTRVVLAAGEWSARLHLAGARSGDRFPVWEVGREDGRAWVDLVLRREASPVSRAFGDWGPAYAVMGLELHGNGAFAGFTDAGPTCDSDASRVRGTWGRLTVAVPLQPGTFGAVRDAGCQ